MSVGHQIVAVTIDQQVKYIISSTIIKVFESLRWNSVDEFAKLDIETAIDMIYSYLSFYPEVISSFFSVSPTLYPSSSITTSPTCTPGMRVTGLRWEERGNSLLYIMSLLGHTILTQLRKISLIQGWRSDEEDSSNQSSNEENRETGGRSNRKLYYDIIKYLLAAVKCSSIINSLFFFVTGEYPNLSYRIAGFKMKRIDSDPKYKNSQLNLESRKMLWYTMIGLVTALTISFDWQYYRNYVYFYIFSIIKQVKSLTSHFHRYQQKFWCSFTSALGRALPFLQIPNLSDSSTDSVSLSEQNESSNSTRGQTHMICSICEISAPQNPYMMNCGHAICYLCYYQCLPPSLVAEKRNKKKSSKTAAKKKTRRSVNADSQDMERITFLSSTGDNEEESLVHDEDDQLYDDENEDQAPFYCSSCYQLITVCKPWRKEENEEEEEN